MTPDQLSQSSMFANLVEHSGHLQRALEPIRPIPRSTLQGMIDSTCRVICMRRTHANPRCQRSAKVYCSVVRFKADDIRYLCGTTATRTAETGLATSRRDFVLGSCSPVPVIFTVVGCKMIRQGYSSLRRNRGSILECRSCLVLGFTSVRRVNAFVEY